MDLLGSLEFDSGAGSVQEELGCAGTKFRPLIQTSLWGPEDITAGALCPVNPERSYWMDAVSDFGGSCLNSKNGLDSKREYPVLFSQRQLAIVFSVNTRRFPTATVSV